MRPIPDYTIETIESAPFAQNSYVFWRQGRTDALVIDPGFEPQAILDLIARERLEPVAILNTHGHVDHIAGNEAMKAAFPNVPLVIGCNEAHLLRDPVANMSAPMGVAVRSPDADRLVADGESFEAAGVTWSVREIPGHSPGSVVYICDEFEPPIVFGGDVLFAGSVGRTDLPGGSFETLRDGIHSKLFTLPEGTRVFPGHGPPTTVARERQSNPFVGVNAGFSYPR